MHGGFTVDRIAAEGPKHIDADLSAKFLGTSCAGADTTNE
jgi:hypothetical protein